MATPIAKRDERVEAVRRSHPSTTRPRLSTESEAKLADVDRRSAECYTDAEAISDSLRELADGTPELLDFEDPSAVHHLEDLRKELVTGETQPMAKPTIEKPTTPPAAPRR